MRRHFTEVWRKVKGYEDHYLVSSFGRIKAKLRVVRFASRWGTMTERTFPERILVPSDVGGRMAVWLHKNGKAKLCSVHILVLEAYTGPRPAPNIEGCHEDGDFKNNRHDNLRWDTHKGNHQDRIRHGTNCAGENNAQAKLTEQMVIEARRLYSTGKYLMKEVAFKLGVHEGLIGRAIKGRTWKHLTYQPNTDFGRGIARLKTMRRW